MSIRVHPSKGVSVSLPYLVPYTAAQAFFKLKREWVIRTLARQQERCKSVQKADPQQVESMRRQAKAELPPRLAELAARYGFTYNRVTIKHNATNWGSCSTRNNINLNLNIVRLPAPLRDYILLHELCHLRHHDHGHAFHLLLEHVCTDNLLKLCETVPSETSSLTGSIGEAYSQAGTRADLQTASDSEQAARRIDVQFGRQIARTAVLSPADVQFARELAHAAAVSNARYPIDHVCTKAIKQYPLI